MTCTLHDIHLLIKCVNTHLSDLGIGLKLVQAIKAAQGMPHNDNLYSTLCIHGTSHRTVKMKSVVSHIKMQHIPPKI